jgi:hypothetical protein
MVMKFTVSDYHRKNGTVWKQVYCMSSDLWPRLVLSEKLLWCIEQFGPLDDAVLPEDRRWSISLDRHSTYYFRDPVDCTAFLLRWS